MQWNRMQIECLSTKKLRNKAYIRSEGGQLGKAAFLCVHAALSATLLSNIPGQPGRCRLCKYSLTSHHQRKTIIRYFHPTPEAWKPKCKVSKVSSWLSTFIDGNSKSKGR